MRFCKGSTLSRPTSQPSGVRASCHMRVDCSLPATAPVHQASGITPQENLKVSRAIDTPLSPGSKYRITIRMGAHAGVSGSSMATVKSETSYKSPPSSISDLSQPECETVRGRRQDRESTSTAKAENESDENKDSVGKPRKRKRSRKGLEKNFPCTHQGCNKSYSRAEHLYRHQLNRKFGLAVTSPAESNGR